MPSLKMIAGAKKFALKARRTSIHSKEKIEKVWKLLPRIPQK